jgi:hypothetical protein
MPYYDYPNPAPALNDCGCGCGGAKTSQPQQLSGYHRKKRRRRGLSDDTTPQIQEIESYLAQLRKKLQTTTLPAAREQLKEEITRYEGILQKELSDLQNANERRTLSKSIEDIKNGGNGNTEKNFLTDDNIISGVPNWAVGIGAAAAVWLAVELAD